MDSGVVVALIGAAGALAIAAYTAWDTRLRVRGDRRSSAATVLNAHRLPLKMAAEDLRHRLRNMRSDRFLVFFADPVRSDLAVKTTLWRLATYLGRIQQVERTIGSLEYQQERTSRSVASALAEIGRTLATDKAYGTGLMIWREEQRAIGGLMLDLDHSPVSTIGFETFVNRYDDVFSPWLGRFAGELVELSRAPTPWPPRLADLEDRLAAAVMELDRGYGG